MALKVYRVWAECISDVYLDVAAENEEEARQIADEADGSEFIDDGMGGDWKVGSAYEEEGEPDEDMVERYEMWKETNE